MSIKKILLRCADVTGITSKIPRSRLDIFLRAHKSDKKTLDIGSGDGPYASYFPNRVSIDIEAGSGVDHVVDAHDLSLFGNESFEIVLSTEALEHLHTPQLAIDEMHRVLRSGGSVILTTRFIFPLHNIPGDYWRFTRYGLKHLFRNFARLEIIEETKTLETIAVLFERLAFQTDTLYFKPLSLCWLILSKLTLVFSFIITKEYGEVNRTQRTKGILSSGYYVVAVK
ncbi:MAG: class I SAM-dependent methyltransferase [bacterium]|nr:class I SAM-dependent methyltransferase [bacterium]MDZ4285536.1 class I SAM-dependent methyltransferase [Candidatus Sungbacteria bacterium]